MRERLGLLTPSCFFVSFLRDNGKTSNTSDCVWVSNVVGGLEGQMMATRLRCVGRKNARRVVWKKTTDLAGDARSVCPAFGRSRNAHITANRPRRQPNNLPASENSHAKCKAGGAATSPSFRSCVIKTLSRWYDCLGIQLCCERTLRQSNASWRHQSYVVDVVVTISVRARTIYTRLEPKSLFVA
jgi:hypothetical protein